MSVTPVSAPFYWLYCLSVLDLFIPSTFMGRRAGQPLQGSCLENPMDRGAWWAAVHGVTKSRTQLSDEHVLHLYGTRTLMARPLGQSGPLPWSLLPRCPTGPADEGARAGGVARCSPAASPPGDTLLFLLTPSSPSRAASSTAAAQVCALAVRWLSLEPHGWCLLRG